MPTGKHFLVVEDLIALDILAKPFTTEAFLNAVTNAADSAA